MNLKKAIEILEDLDPHGEPDDNLDLTDAIKLLIEAGKVVLKVRHHPFPDEILLLPGETEE